eukprot:1475042-Rhodomonas_salina.1
MRILVEHGREHKEVWALDYKLARLLFRGMQCKVQFARHQLYHPGLRGLGCSVQRAWQGSAALFALAALLILWRVCIRFVLQQTMLSRVTANPAQPRRLADCWTSRGGEGRLQRV